MQEDKKKTGIIIPPERLSKEALHGLVEEFILREGTDYGTREYSLDEKMQHIWDQLKNKKIVIFYDPDLETTTILRREELKRLDLKDVEIVN